jgi:hypothetical protein
MTTKFTCFTCNIKFHPCWKINKREGTFCDYHREDTDEPKYNYFNCLSCKLRVYIKGDNVPENYLVGARAYCNTCLPRFTIPDNKKYNSTCAWCEVPCIKSKNYIGNRQLCNVCKHAKCSQCVSFKYKNKRQCSYCNPDGQSDNDPECIWCRDVTKAYSFQHMYPIHKDVGKKYLCFSCNYEENDYYN